MVGANGITGVKSLSLDSVDKNKLFVASIFGGQIHVYNFPASPKALVKKQGFKRLQKIKFDFIMDNLATDSDFKWLYLTGHGAPGELFKHYQDRDQVIAPSVAYRLSLEQMLGGFFGTRGEMGEVKVEKLVVDNKVSSFNAKRKEHTSCNVS